MILSNDNKYKGNLGETFKLDEYSHVEQPFIEQLKALGWNTGRNQVLELKLQQTPDHSYRTSFSEVVLLPKLRNALTTINPFLTDAQADEVVRKITSFQKSSLIENNEQVLTYLLENTTVSKNEKQES